jgi:hypothetical protein
MRKGISVVMMVLLLAVLSLAGNFFGNPASAVNALPIQELSSEEIDGLMQMREEEKLARDVYLTLYDIWGIPTFYNISQSEQTHMDAVKALLDKYDLEDPIKDFTIGIFSDENLQKLYNELVSEGQKSIVDALKVGATIEDLDIYDLDKFLEETDNKDIQLVYENLKQGSENHMRAFVKVLEKYNASYSAQYISPDYLSEILGKSN